MTERYCMVCNEIFDGNTYTIELNDDREKLQISGHPKCIDGLYERMRSVKDYQKKPINKILKEIKFKLDI
jgi:hypothetical protein